MKNVIGQILAVILGVLIGFFGVFVSVFADGSLNERITTIVVILLIYCVLGLIWGWLIPEKSWQWGLYLGIPGSVILLIYSMTELTRILYYIGYISLILLIPSIAAYFSAKGKGI